MFILFKHEEEFNWNNLNYKDVSQNLYKVQKIAGADYFMEKPLHKIFGEELFIAMEVLKELVRSSKKIGSKSIVLPCLDNSSFSDLNEMKKFQELISDVIPLAEDLDINLALETDLDSATFSTLLATDVFITFSAPRMFVRTASKG